MKQWSRDGLQVFLQSWKAVSADAVSADVKVLHYLIEQGDSPSPQETCT